MSDVQAGSNLDRIEHQLGAVLRESCRGEFPDENLNRGENGARCRVRTCDPIGVNDVLYH
jgi:hypothetical protein